MDENSRRKRIEITNDEQIDDMSMDNPEAPVGTSDDTNEEIVSSLPFESTEDTGDEPMTSLDESSEDIHEPESEDGPLDDNTSVEDTSLETTPEAPEELVETEVEPETAATTLVEQEPATVADRPSAFPPTEVPSDTQTSDGAPLVAPVATSHKDKKRLLVIAAASGLLIVATIIGWWLMSRKEEVLPPAGQTTDTITTPVEQPKLGIAVTVVEGTVEYMKEDSTWRALDNTTPLEEGDSVRTGKESRLVLTLDDGSAIRLDANSTIRLTSLTANQVDVEHLDGIAYSRIVPSTTRTYTVTIDGTKYQAIGTAFATIKSETKNGVWVFENSVKVNGSADAVAEGKQFFQTIDDAKLEGLVSEIDIDSLANDPFINWNLTLDEKDLTFKDKLGILPMIKKRAAEMKKEAAREKAEKAREAAEKEAEEKAREAAEKENEDEDDRRSGMSGNVMTLSASDTSLLKWNYLGDATNGYKVVYSKQSRLPVLGADASLYFKDNTQTSTRLSTSKMKGKYFVRVCAYTKENTCIDYSNVVIINI